MGNMQELLALAESQQGYQEKSGNKYLDDFDADAGHKNYTKYARDVNIWGLQGCQGQPWCATYQFWLEAKTFGVEKALDHYHMRKKSYQGYNCFATYRAFEKVGKISREPKTGALIVFNHSHIGRVIDVRGGRVYTNEGNTSALYGDRNGGTVREKSYLVGDKNIKGYCIMEYCTGEQSENTEKADCESKGTSKLIQIYQKWLNVNYGKLMEHCMGEQLAEDGIYGEKSRNASLAVWKDVLNRKQGCSLTPGNITFGERCRKAAKYAEIKKGSKGTFVAVAEGILTAKGFYADKFDAEFGSLLGHAVKEFQKQNGLKADGIIGAKTWEKLFCL